MVETTINTGLIKALISILFALMFILPILMGAFRGLKKSAFRLAWVVVFSVLGFAFMALISQAVVNIDITAFNIEVEGTIATTIPHFIELNISNANPDMAQLVADNPEVLTMLVSLAISIINMFIFVIWYWITKWLLWPVWAIISHFIFKSKTVKTSKVLKDGRVIGERQQVVKAKKYAWAGALIGVAMGVMSLMFTAIPFAGITDTLMRIEQATITTQEDGSQKGLLTANMGENIEVIYMYANSPAGVVLSAVGVNQISTAMAKTIASTTTNGVTTCALDEIVGIASLSNEIQTLSSTDFQNLTQQGWTETLPAIKNVANKVLTSGVVKTCYDKLVPYIIDNMLQDPDYFIQLPDLEDEILNKALKDILNKVKTITAEDINNDIKLLIDIVDDINNSNILTELVKGEVTLEYMQQNVTTELGDKINQKIFDMQTVGKILPVCLERAVEYLCSQLDVVYVPSQTSLTAQQVEQFFSSLITDYIIIFKNYDASQDVQIATNTFENLGDIVDSLKESGIVNTATFNNLMDYVVEQINIELQNANLKTSVQTLLQDVLADIKLIPSFKDELKNIGSALQVAIDEQIDIENLDIKSVTKVLDKVLTTFIYQYNIDAVETCVADFVNEYCIENDINISQNTVSTICDNISNVYSFELEYAKIEDLVNYVEQMLQQGDFESHLKNTDTMSTLGGHLDTTVDYNSVLLSDANCKLILQDIIKNVELPADLQLTKINGQDIVDVMAQNVNHITSYQTEFVHISNILNINGGATLSQYGKALDSVKQSVLLNDILNQVVSDKITQKADSLNITDAELIAVVNKVKANVSNITSYQTEFEYLQQFIDINPEDATMTSFGTMLDSFVDSNLFGNTTNDLLLYALNKGKSEVDQVYYDIYNNLTANVQNLYGKVYAQELSYVQSFVDFTNNGEPKTRANIEQYLNDNILNTDGSSKSILIDTEITNQILALAVV